MNALPAQIAPPAPFPAILAQAQWSEFVAPGISRSEIRLRTSAGPLIVHVVEIDPAEPTVRFGVVLAHDRLISAGETTSSMANRTGAVAGVNADYFDIGNTNQPLNIVKQRGALVRSPSSRIALYVAGRQVGFAYPSFHGTVGYAGSKGANTNIPLTGVNIWPPDGGASLMTSAYGIAPTVPAGVTAVGVASVHDISLLDPSARLYAVNDAPVDWSGTVLGFGPAALAIDRPPASGSVIVTAALGTPFDVASEAAGGGPLLVRGGAVATDPNEPAPEERSVRFPVSGAGVMPDGTVLLAAVDGRLPAASIGVTRPEFAALFIGLGAGDAMAFDSGGSATLVARALGDDRAGVLNAPSDGMERPVADGLFVYSDAPAGANPHLFARPAAFEALPGAEIPVSAAIVDDAGHRIRRVDAPPIVAGGAPGDHQATIRSGSYATTVGYRTVDRLAALRIEPERPNPAPRSSIGLQARGFDALGNAVALEGIRWFVNGNSPGWNTSGASRLNVQVATTDLTLTASAGGVTATTQIRVGSHLETPAIFGAASAWSFATAPRGGPGSAERTAGELALTYDLSTVRAAYANAVQPAPLPGEPSAFEVDVLGDASGIGLRAAFVNRFGERRALTLSQRVTWTGWKRLHLDLPPDLNAPVRLVSLYAVRLGTAPAQAAGTLHFRNPAVVVPGSS